MKATDEYGIRMRKALDYFFGAKELGLSREQMCSELKRLEEDQDLLVRLHEESQHDLTDRCYNVDGKIWVPGPEEEPTE